MPSKKHRQEKIIGQLGDAEFVLAQWGATAEACRRIAVSEQTYYRWRKKYGGRKTDQACRMKDLEKDCTASTRDLGSDAGQADLAEGRPGKLLSPARRWHCIGHIRTMMPVSERRPCRVLGLTGPH